MVHRSTYWYIPSMYLNNDRYVWHKLGKQHPQKYFSKHGIYWYVQVCTTYILVYTSWTTCTLSWERPYTCPTHPVTVSLHTGQTQRNVCSHSFMTALFRLIHTCMYVVCSSTYAHRSRSHFISNHHDALSPLRPLLVSFRHLSDVLRAAAESCLSEVSSMVRPPRRGLTCPTCSSCQPCSETCESVDGVIHKWVCIQVTMLCREYTNLKSLKEA